MIQIHLRPPDQQWATEVGQRRFQLLDGPGLSKERDLIDSAGGQLAFARALGIEWQARIGTPPDAPDVFPSWKVRTTRTTKGIRVSPDDPDDALVVWVSGKLPEYQIMGYIRAGGAKNHPEWFKNPGSRSRAVYLVPTNRIIEIDPGFHRLCEYLVDDWGQWSCAFCGVASGAA